MFRKLLIISALATLAVCTGCGDDVSGTPASTASCVTVLNPSVLEETNSDSEELPSGVMFIKQVAIDCDNGSVGVSLRVRSHGVSYLDTSITAVDAKIDPKSRIDVPLQHDGETQDGWLQLITLGDLKKVKEMRVVIEVIGRSSNGGKLVQDGRIIDIASKE